MYTKSFHILLIEDNPGDARLVDLMLNEDALWGHVTVTHEKTLAGGIKRLEEETVDAVLLDLSLPDSHGMETLQRLQVYSLEVPIVVLTGQEDERLGIEAVKIGAQDFLSKNNLTGSLLGRAVRYAYERRVSERELRSSEERFRKTFENAPIGMATADMNMNYSKVNKAFCDFIGYTEEELIGMNFDHISYPEELEETRRNAQRLLHGVIDSFQMEKRYLHKKGHVVWGLLNLTIVRLGDNRFFLGQIRDINEQKLTEEKLRSSERRYRALFNVANDEILVFQLDERHKVLPFMEVNDFACRQLGYSREELLQLKISDIVAASKKDLKESLNRLIKNREMVLKTHHIAKDGRHIPMEVNAHLFELNGRPTVMVIGRDITERIKTERSLRKERNFVSAIVDTAGALIVVFDYSGRIVRFNPACEKMTGYDADEIIGMQFEELLIVDEEVGQVQEVFNHLRNGEFPIEHENNWITKSGELRRINWSNTCIYNEDGEVEFIIAIGNDVTERRKVERALQESEVKYRAIVETTAEAIITVDPNGRVESFNSSAENIFDYEREQVLGSDFMQLVAPSYRAEQLERLALLQAGDGEPENRETSSELKGLRSNGSEFYMEMSVNRVKLNGRILVTCILRDITERRQLEQQILEISDQEKRRIGQDLHDGLGQMLTGIQLITKSLSRKLKEEIITYKDAAAEADEVADLMHEADEQARGLARGLVPVDLDQDGLILALRRLTNNSERMFGIQCKFEEYIDIPIQNNVMAIHLYRIAQEAISNAYKHGKATEIQVALASSEDSVRLRIQDNGRGFPEKIQDSPGMGVKIMNYRARLIGGYLNISRDLMGNTIITCTVPRTTETQDHIKEEQVNSYEKNLDY